MKIKKNVYSIACDSCGIDMLEGEDYSGLDDFKCVLGMMNDYFWKEINGKHYCNGCYEYNEKDEPVIKHKPDMRKDEFYQGQLVTYRLSWGPTKYGRVKSVTDKLIFVVFNCGGDWPNYKNYTADGCKRCDLIPGWII